MTVAAFAAAAMFAFAVGDSSGGSPEQRQDPASSETSLAAEDPILAALRKQVAENRAVRGFLLGIEPGADPGGTVLCGLDVLRRDSDRLYAWVLCGIYTTGPAAEVQSAAASPVVLTVQGTGEATILTNVDIPIRDNADSLALLFPPDLVEVINDRDVDPAPDSAGLLAEARLLSGAGALEELAAAASQGATDLPTLLLVANQSANVVVLTSADGKNTATIDPGKSLQFASERVCAWLPLTASTPDGRIIEIYAQPCDGQTWTISD